MVSRRMNFEEKIIKLLNQAREGEFELGIYVSSDDGVYVTKDSVVEEYEDCIEIFKEDKRASQLIPYDKIILVRIMETSLARELDEKHKEQIERLSKSLEKSFENFRR